MILTLRHACLLGRTSMLQALLPLLFIFHIFEKKIWRHKIYLYPLPNTIIKMFALYCPYIQFLSHFFHLLPRHIRKQFFLELELCDISLWNKISPFP